MKIGIRITIAGLVLTAIVISTACVHFVWWRTAELTSRDLAATINQQIVVRGRSGALRIFELLDE